MPEIQIAFVLLHLPKCFACRYNPQSIIFASQELSRSLLLNHKIRELLSLEGAPGCPIYVEPVSQEYVQGVFECLSKDGDSTSSLTSCGTA